MDLVIGMGEVGQAVYDLIGESLVWDISSPEEVRPSMLPRYEVMHICFPYKDESFIKDVQQYIRDYEPKHIVVWSTVPIGTCRLIGEEVCHSPVEGLHPFLGESIKKMVRFIGYNIGEEGRFFVKYFNKLHLNTESTSKTESTELLKLRSTARYGINIAFAQYEADLCEKFGVPYSDIMVFDTAYNGLYEQLGEPSFKRYILFPPNGKIGGHCIVPNARLLSKQLPSPMLDMIINMGSKK